MSGKVADPEPPAADGGGGHAAASATDADAPTTTTTTTTTTDAAAEADADADTGAIVDATEGEGGEAACSPAADAAPAAADAAAADDENSSTDEAAAAADGATAAATEDAPQLPFRTPPPPALYDAAGAASEAPPPLALRRLGGSGEIRAELGGGIHVQMTSHVDSSADQEASAASGVEESWSRGAVVSVAPASPTSVDDDAAAAPAAPAADGGPEVAAAATDADEVESAASVGGGSMLLAGWATVHKQGVLSRSVRRWMALKEMHLLLYTKPFGEEVGRYRLYLAKVEHVEGTSKLSISGAFLPRGVLEVTAVSVDEALTWKHAFQSTMEKSSADVKPVLNRTASNSNFAARQKLREEWLSEKLSCFYTSEVQDRTVDVPKVCKKNTHTQ